MLKEVATLIFILWCTQAFPTTTVQKKDRSLPLLLCDAKLLFSSYKNGTHFPPDMRATIEREFSGPNCNFTKAPKRAEICEIIQAYHKLFASLNKMKRNDQLLKPLMANHKLSSVVHYQENYLGSNCQVPQISTTQIKYTDFNHDPSRQNMFYYIFEQYQKCTLNLWRQQLTEKVDESHLCGREK